MAYQIYKITNKINQKSYIGLTTRDYLTRWSEHVQIAYNENSKDSESIFKKAIRKYGKDAWEIAVIEQLEQENIDLLKEREKYWIDYYKTFAFDKNSKGYNSTRGGDGLEGWGAVSLTQCDIITGQPIKIYESIRAAERDINVRIEGIGKPNRSSGGYCFLITEDIKDMTLEQLKKYVHSLYPYLVYQLDLEGNFIKIHRNTIEASNYIKGSTGNLISCCEGKRRLMKGYQWVYQKDIEERLGKPVKPLDPQGCPITQYKMNGEKIQDWINIRTASKELDISETHISSCCKLKRQSAGKFQWRYAEEDIEKLEPLYVKRKVICNETQEIFDTCNHAAKHYGYSQATVKKSCMGNVIQKPLSFSWYDE